MNEETFIELNGLKHLSNCLYYVGMFRIWIDDKISIYYMSKLKYKSDGLSPSEFAQATNILQEG